jgi:hypothetical protein
MTLCPTCENQKNAQPVSEVYNEEVAAGGTSDLAWALAPPRIEPRLPDHGFQDREENRILLPFMVLLILLGVGVAIYGGGIGGFLIVTLPGALVGLVVAKMYASTRYHIARAEALSAAAREETMPAHLQRVQQWEDASYCNRDEIIFFSDGSKPLTTIEFRNLMTGVKPPAARA